MLATKSQSEHLINPWRTEHIRRATRGKSGEIQELWDSLGRTVLMLEGHVSQPKVRHVTPGVADVAKASTFTINGKNFIPFGWRQARLTIDPTGANNGLEWIAVQPGKDGNDIQVEYVDGGALAPTAVDYAAGVVTVAIDMGAGDTAVNVLIALAASATGAQYVVQARHVFASTGAGNITTVVAAANLAGGMGLALRRATLTIGAGANSRIVWTSRKPGVDGQLTTVAYVTGLGAGVLPIITVLGTHISIMIRAASTTANDILRVLETNEDARRLAEAHLVYGDTGAGLPGLVAATALAGGTEGTAVRFVVGGLEGAITEVTDTQITAEVLAVAGAIATDVVGAELDICGFEHRLDLIAA